MTDEPEPVEVPPEADQPAEEPDHLEPGEDSDEPDAEVATDK